MFLGVKDVLVVKDEELVGIFCSLGDEDISFSVIFDDCVLDWEDFGGLVKDEVFPPKGRGSSLGSLLLGRPSIFPRRSMSESMDL